METLTGKRVFIFDLETTGLPIMKNVNKKREYDDYKNNASYYTSRIVSVAWYYDDNFNPQKINYDNIKEYIVKPVDYTEIPTTHIHGISFEKAVNDGLDFNDILYSKGLGKDILSSDVIVGHNCLFDINILLNELYRNSSLDVLEYFEKLLLHKQYFCTADAGKDICKLPNQYSTTEYKRPRLTELYFHYFNKYPNNSHNATDDVLSVLQILSCFI